MCRHPRYHRINFTNLSPPLREHKPNARQARVANWRFSCTKSLCGGAYQAPRPHRGGRPAAPALCFAHGCCMLRTLKQPSCTSLLNCGYQRSARWEDTARASSIRILNVTMAMLRLLRCLSLCCCLICNQVVFHGRCTVPSPLRPAPALHAVGRVPADGHSVLGPDFLQLTVLQRHTLLCLHDCLAAP